MTPTYTPPMGQGVFVQPVQPIIMGGMGMPGMGMGGMGMGMGGMMMPGM